MTNSARPLDHLVLPVPALEVARARLSALGFTLAPQGTHPFGTVNACVFFRDGTFLEPLAVGDPVGVVNALHAGNAFVAGDTAFRAAHGGNGFSALVLASHDADADQAGFAAAGHAGGQRLDFARPFRTPAGEEAVAAFRLAFAAPGDNPTAYFFTCERVNPPKVDRSALEAHANGVTGIARVILASAEPARHAGFLEAFTGGPAEPVAGGLCARLPNGEVLLLDPDATQALTGLRPDVAGSAICAAAIAFSGASADRLSGLLSAAGIDAEPVAGAIRVPPAPGQGATFIFED